MTTENTSAPAREIPVPPGGGSWTFDNDTHAWISNDPVQAADADVSDTQPANTIIEQEQQ